MVRCCPNLGCGAELVPEVVVEGVTIPRNASTEPATLQNVVRGECFYGLLQAFPGSTTDQRKIELKYRGLNYSKISPPHAFVQIPSVVHFLTRTW